LNLFEPVESRKQILWQPGVFLVWATITGIGRWLHADSAGHGTHQELGLPPCPTALFLNRPCPGCGLTTSWTALLHGQWSLAFHAHPLGPAMYALFTAAAFLGVYGTLTKQRLNIDSPSANRFFAACAFIFLGFGFTRMAVTTDYRSDLEQMYAKQLGIVKNP